MIIARAYFATISPSVFESASIGGVGEVRKCFLIAVPLAKPIIAVLALYVLVGYWNSYFTPLLYLDDVSKHPLQNYLQKILFTALFLLARGRKAKAARQGGLGGTALLF